ncbi:hypothetical protein [Thermogemmatispora carboxidivorans]|uniref:hypothetical protein n=1 Tax=Thermogemmatispora carboxidivorans TaxID=1382306 RepID=UPI00069BF44F|nr:hypothetical protein [Thermogemmatispora carboxidivorans]
MTGSLEKPSLGESRPGEEGAGESELRHLPAGGEEEVPTEKREKVEEEIPARTVSAVAEGGGDGRQEQALVVPAPGAMVADHREDTLPLERPGQGSAGSQAAFYSAPTLPVLPPEPSPRAPRVRSRPWPGLSQRATHRRAADPPFKKLWIGTLIASLLLLLVSISLLVYLVGVLAAREGLTPASLLSATASGKLAGVQRGQDDAAIELALFPQSFSPANCLPDNGYRCTATLMASGPAGNVRWQAWSQGVAARFNPASSSIEPGQQQQVIIYLPATCPISGKLIFSWNNRQLSVPWRC